MQQRARYFVSAVGLLLSVSGCPVTDDYFLLDDKPPGQGGETSQAGAGNGGSTTAGSGTGGVVDQGGSTAQAGSTTTGGTPSAGTATAGEATMAMGGMPDAGGGPPVDQAGAPGGEGGAAGAPTVECVPTTERCNGRDDDCDDSVDEFACMSSCYGFVLATDPNHGYMLCNGARKANSVNAAKACEDQDMRLAWLTSAAENAAVALRLDTLGTDAEVLFGATDQGNEGDWLWAGGPQFWKGNENGYPVGGLYDNWANNTPNNTNNEDCALVNVMTGAWGDRTCNAIYAYVCEQPD